MLCVDVSNHFTSVPVSETVPLISSVLEKKGLGNQCQNRHFKHFCSCLSYNFSIINNKYYSLFLTDICMDHFENNFILNRH